MKKYFILLALVASILVTGCSSLMVSINDKDETAKEIKLSSGETVSVLLPVIDEKLKQEIADAGFTNNSFKEELRNQLIKELISRGIKPISADNTDSNYIRLHVNRLERGIGFFRWVPLFGLGNSFLTVDVILSTTNGKRELVAEKNGQITGMSQMGDQTKDNIEYIATAVASRITK